MGKYKDISVDQENSISNENMLQNEIDINLEEINIEYENEKITLKQYLNITNNRIYLIAPKDRLHLWGWVNFREKVNGRLLEYKSKDNKIIYQIIETNYEITLEQLNEFGLYIANVLK
ncbi:MAG TPA: hypothetical protein VF839_02100 [Clostridium sp.]